MLPKFLTHRTESNGCFLKPQSFELIFQVAIATGTKLNPDRMNGMHKSVMSKESGKQIQVSINFFFFFLSWMRVVKDVILGCLGGSFS